MKKTTVMGVHAPAPRATLWGRALLLIYVGLPLIGALAALDLALWFAFDRWFGWCYGVACLVE